MQGFKITINDKIFSVASDSLVSVHIGVGCCSEDNYIWITGLDSKLYHLTWYEHKLYIGDKIKVQVTEIDKISPLQKSYPQDRLELRERYFQMKKELEEAGLI